MSSSPVKLLEVILKIFFRDYYQIVAHLVGQLVFVYQPSSVFISLSVCLSTCIYYFWLFLCLSASAFLTLADSNQPFSEQVLIIIVIKFLVDWKTELLEYIDEDNLPEYYGGTCKDPDGDPLCRSKVDSKSFQS